MLAIYRSWEMKNFESLLCMPEEMVQLGPELTHNMDWASIQRNKEAYRSSFLPRVQRKILELLEENWDASAWNVWHSSARHGTEFIYKRIFYGPKCPKSLSRLIRLYCFALPMSLKGSGVIGRPSSIFYFLIINKRVKRQYFLPILQRVQLLVLMINVCHKQLLNVYRQPCITMFFAA